MYKAQHLLGFVILSEFVMKGILTFLFATMLVSTSNAQNIFDQLNASVERTQGGAGATVEYHIYLSPTTVKVFHASDWEKGAVKYAEGGAKYFELTRQKEGEEESFLINLDRVAYIELGIKTVKGQKEFKYQFYY